ncbi:MAG: hypothetical protein IJ217_03790 [Clostridia bacterium]|nr:hypothetical protein [Clostridia bacterium]
MSYIDRIAENFRYYAELLKSYNEAKCSLAAFYSSVASMSELFKKYDDLMIHTNVNAEDYFEDELRLLLFNQEQLIEDTKEAFRLNV